MAGTPQPGQKRAKKRPGKYLSHCSKRRKEMELRSGLQGFLITCEGGKERISIRQAIQVLERFYDDRGEEKAAGNDTEGGSSGRTQEIDSQNNKASTYEEEQGSDKDEQLKPDNQVSSLNFEAASARSSDSEKEDEDEATKISTGATGGPIKKANIESLLEEEIADLRDVKQALFASVDTGCAGVIFIRMLSKDAVNETSKKGPGEVVQAVVENCVEFRKPLTRFCLRFLPIEVTCYASPEEVKKMAHACLLRHFPAVDKEKAFKFAVVYEARANTSLDRMEMINAVAKLIPEPHSVDLKNPDKTILVQVVKTICAIGVVANYKHFAKYNIRELTSSKHQLKES